MPKGGASIAAPYGLRFGDSFSVIFSPAAGPDKDYWARADCYADDTTIGQPPGSAIYAQYVHLEAGIQQGPFVLGPTPSWQGGGASCAVRLIAYNGKTGTFSKPYATDDFTVGP